MSRCSKLLRCLAVAVYTAALLGALIVPHAHHADGDACCGHDAAGVCPTGESRPSPHAGCRHAHPAASTAKSKPCCHHHHHAAGEHESSPADDSEPAAPFDSNCPVCRFLAQAVQLATPPALLIGAAEVPRVADAVAVFVSATPADTPPARGPPAC